MKETEPASKLAVKQDSPARRKKEGPAMNQDGPASQENEEPASKPAVKLGGRMSSQILSLQ